MKVNANYSGDDSQKSEFTDPGLVADLTDYLTNRKGWVPFDDIKQGVPALADAEAGEIHQACFDSGFTKVDL